MRRALGFKLEGTEALLTQFLTYLDEHDADTITIEHALSFVTAPQGASPRGPPPATRACRSPPARLLPARPTRAAPYIYRDDQIEALLVAADQLRPAIRATTLHTLIALVAATGIRTGEAIGLDVSSLDRAAATLQVSGKYGKTRLLSLHPTVLDGLTDYLDTRSRFVPAGTCPALLISSTGRRLPPSMGRSESISRRKGTGLRKLSALVHNLPLTMSVLRKHVGRAGQKASSVVLRGAPARARSAMTGEWIRARRPDLAALALAADERYAEASALLRATLEGTLSQAAQARVARVAVVLHDLPLAQEALTGQTLDQSRPAGQPPPSLAMTRSMVAAEQGNLDVAVAHLHGVPGRAARRMRSQLKGEVQVLRTEMLLDELAGSASEKQTPCGGAVTSVLHVVSTSLPEQQSGYTIRTQGIVTGQRAAGLDAQVVTRLGFPVDTGVIFASPWAEVGGVPYHRLLPGRGIPIPSARRQEVAVARLTELVQRLRPDVLHAHSKHENAQIALTVGRRLGLPVVYEARGFLEETWVSSGGTPDSDFYRWSREAESLCLQHADVVITLSQAMASDIESRGISAGRITVIPNAVPADFANSKDATPSRAGVGAGMRARLGIPADSTVFGSVSTVNDYEGFDTVIEAMTLLHDHGVVLLIVGDGPARPGLQARAESAGVADRVVFTGRVPHAQVRDHLDAIDVFVVPRKVTPVTVLVPPIKPLEAMAVGIPVLASDLPPLVEIVRPGAFGEVAAAQDAVAWAEQMAALRYAPEHLHALGLRASEFVARERTWARAADRYAKVYDAAVLR